MKFDEQVGAIKQLEHSIKFNFWEIGKRLKEIEDRGGELKQIIVSNFTFSYGYGMSMKRWYEESLRNKNLGAEILGLEKTLDIVRPLKGSTNEFLIQHPVEELKGMTQKEVRSAVKHFKDSRESAPEVSPPKLTPKHESFFLQAEDNLREVALTFEGIQQRYEEEFKSWDGKDRVFAQLDRLKAVLGVFK